MGGKTETTTRSRTNPAKWLMPHINTVLGSAQSQYAQGQPTFAGFSPTTETALQGLEQGSPLVSSAQGMLQDTLEGKYLTPDSNPFLRQYGDALSGHIQDRVNAEFSKAGRYGSGAHAGTTAREIGNTLSGLYGNAYSQERGRQFGAAPLAPGLGFSNINAQLGAGQMRDVKAQQEVDDPYNQIMRYLSIIRGVPQGTESFGKQTTKSTPGALDWIGTAGGLLGSMGGMGMFGGMGAPMFTTGGTMWG